MYAKEEEKMHEVSCGFLQCGRVAKLIASFVWYSSRKNMSNHAVGMRNIGKVNRVRIQVVNIQKCLKYALRILSLATHIPWIECYVYIVLNRTSSSLKYNLFV